MNELLEKYAELIYDYPLAQNLAYIYPRYIETYLKADQKQDLKDAVLNITGFVRRIFMKNPDQFKCVDSSIDFDGMKKAIKNEKILEVLNMIQ